VTNAHDGPIPGDELPAALPAFRSYEFWPEAAVTRAATLLTLAPVARDDYLLSETREGLRIPAARTVADPLELGESLRDLPGDAGAIAASFLDPYLSAERFEGVLEGLPSEEQLVRGELPTGEVILGAQAREAESFFGEGRSRAETFPPSNPATRLAALSLLDPVPVVRVSAAAAVLRIHSTNQLAAAILRNALHWDRMSSRS
jgi:hypothetical protein